MAAIGGCAARGYRRALAGPVDFQLAYEVGESVWTGVEGATALTSISLALTSAKSERRVWVGFARAEVKPAATSDERARRLREAFDELLAEFPPSSRSR